MSNTCHNALTVKGPATAEQLAAIAEMVIKYVLDNEHFHADGGDHMALFCSRWSPPIKEVHLAQNTFPDLSIELHFAELMTSLQGQVLPDGRLREDVLYETDQMQFIDLGYRIWDSSGKVLIEDHSKPVPARHRVKRKMRSILYKLRRSFKPDPVHTDDAFWEIPF